MTKQANMKPWWERKGGWQHFGTLYKESLNGHLTDSWGAVFVNKDKKRQELRFGKGEDPPNPDEDSPTFQRVGDLVYYVQDRLGYKVQPCHYCRKFLK